MLALRILFVVLAVLSLVCTIAGVLVKRKNIGYILMALLVVAANIVAFLVLGVNNAEEASRILNSDS